MELVCIHNNYTAEEVYVRVATEQREADGDRIGISFSFGCQGNFRYLNRTQPHCDYSSRLELKLGVVLFNETEES